MNRSTALLADLGSATIVILFDCKRFQIMSSIASEEVNQNVSISLA
jgi:hypothetical protein